MTRLDTRLRAVAAQIRSATHVDIGSDHAHLLVALLNSGRIERGIAIENKQQPYQNSRRALTKLAADVRFGDGLAVLKPGEADSLSICGMGARSIVQILNAFPDRIPLRIVLQPNRQPELIRTWALQSGFHVLDERIARGRWAYSIMSFQHAGHCTDPAYADVDHTAAILFGPLNLKRLEPAFKTLLQEEFDYLSRFARLEPRGIERRAAIERVIAARSDKTIR